MSEIKPVFWIKKEHFAEFEGARGDLGLTIVAWNNSLNEYAKAHELKSMEVPLFTADQLAEAVAAERERIVGLIEKAKPYVCTNPSREITPGDFQRIEGMDTAIEAIRSTTK